jgi:cell division protein FtsB
MKLLVIILAVLLILLQYKLWIGEGSLVDVWQLSNAIEAQQQDNEQLTQRNAELEAEVKDLKHGYDAVEERARSELGMIKKDETFYQIVEEEP